MQIRNYSIYLKNNLDKILPELVTTQAQHTTTLIIIGNF